MEKSVLNGHFGKFADGGIPRLYPGVLSIDEYSYRLNSRTTLPTLEVPAAPVELAPEPESASVQLLRSLLTDRRREKSQVEGARKSRQHQIDELRKRIDDLTARNEQDDRHIAAADASIEQILKDIALLGGKPEDAAPTA